MQNWFCTHFIYSLFVFIEDSGADSDDEMFNRNNNYNTNARPRKSILKSTPE